jgi:hypothetical protein
MLKVMSTAAALLMAGCGLAQAGERMSEQGAQAPIVLAANGCGRGFFRTIAGDCEPNMRMRGPGGAAVAPPPCPRGYRRDPDPATPLCYPVY